MGEHQTICLKIVLLHYMISTLVSVTSACFDERLTCSENIDTGELHFTTSPAKSFPYCEHGASSLVCCISGDVLQMTWHRRNNVTDAWRDITPDRADDLCENNQVLNINDPVEEDGGSYRCTAIDNSGTNITHIVNFVMHTCSGGSDPDIVQIIEPVDGDVLTHDHGDNATFKCRVFIGGDPHYQTAMGALAVQWEKINSTTDTMIARWMASYLPKLPSLPPGMGDFMPLGPAPSNGQDAFIPPESPSMFYLQQEGEEFTRYFIEKDPIETPNYASILLHITNISAPDFGLYRCTIIVHGPPIRSKIALKERIYIVVVVIPAAHNQTLIGVFIIILLVLMVAVLMYATQLHWRLAIKDKFATPDRPDRTFDAFVVHDNTCPRDSELVYCLHTELHDNRKYKLAHAHNELLLDDSEMHNYESLINASQCIVYIVSESSLKHSASQWVFQHFYEKKDDRRLMVFLICDPIPEHAWQPDNEALKHVLEQESNVIHVPRNIMPNGSSRKNTNPPTTPISPSPQSPQTPTTDTVIFQRGVSQAVLLSQQSGPPTKSKRTRWAEVNFWKHLRLALPPKLSSIEKAQPSISTTSKSNMV